MPSPLVIVGAPSGAGACAPGQEKPLQRSVVLACLSISIRKASASKIVGTSRVVAGVPIESIRALGMWRRWRQSREPLQTMLKPLSLTQLWC
jgi:hypothetical protein